MILTGRCGQACPRARLRKQSALARTHGASDIRRVGVASRRNRSMSAFCCSLMPPGLHQIAKNSFFSQLPARFQAMQPFYQDETFAIPAHEDWYLLPDLQYAFGDLLCLLGIERDSALGRHVDA